MHRMADWSGCPETLFFQHQALLHSCDLSVAVPLSAGCSRIIWNRKSTRASAGGFEHSSNCAAVPTVLLSRRSKAFGGLNVDDVAGKCESYEGVQTHFMAFHKQCLIREKLQLNLPQLSSVPFDQVHAVQRQQDMMGLALAEPNLQNHNSNEQQHMQFTINLQVHSSNHTWIILASKKQLSETLVKHL